LLPTSSNLRMLKNVIKCDLTIVLNKTEETIMAHSYVLTSRSNTLAIPLAKQAQKKFKYLRILDIDTSSFLLLLK